ncbi:MAG: PaaI family thioesterase [Ilumatobacteraceae bacterium]
MTHEATHDERRARAGRAVRDLGHALIGHEADDALIDDVARTLDELTARLSAGSARTREQRGFQQGEAWVPPADGEAFTSHDDRPVSGRSSPWGLDPEIRRVGDEVEATVTLRSAHEGAPGRSHGGIVAALFDDVYGFILQVHRLPAFTGELTVRYVGPTPLYVPLTCRVRFASREGRKLFMTGEITTADGTTCVTSKATFISIDTYTVPAWGDGV